MIKCQHCGCMDERFDAVKFNADWIRWYVADFFSLPVEVLKSPDHSHKSKRFRYVYSYIATKWAGVKRLELAHEFMVTAMSVTNFITHAEKHYTNEIRVIEEYLTEEMNPKRPEVIIEEPVVGTV